MRHLLWLAVAAIAVCCSAIAITFYLTGMPALAIAAAFAGGLAAIGWIVIDHRVERERQRQARIASQQRQHLHPSQYGVRQ